MSGLIAIDAAGYVYVTGYVQTLSSTYNIVTIKYSPAGVQQWASFYTAPAPGRKPMSLDGRYG